MERENATDGATPCGSLDPVKGPKTHDALGEEKNSRHEENTSVGPTAGVTVEDLWDGVC